MGARQLRKIKGEVCSVKITKALKHIHCLPPSPHTLFSIPFNLLSVTLGKAYSMLQRYSNQSQLRNQQNAQPKARGAVQEADLTVSRFCRTSHKY